MHLRSFLLLLALPFALVLLVACGGEPDPPPPPPVDPTLTNVQNRVLSLSCSLSGSCHKGASAAGQLNLETGMSHAQLMRASTEVTTKMLVVAGQPDASYLMDKLLNRNLPTSPNPQDPWTSMPPGVLLEADRLELIRAWIAAGAKND